jgi:hypothetical protein
VGAWEAEARARVEEGIGLAIEWAPGQVILETNCAQINHAMRSGEDISEVSFAVQEANDLKQALSELRIV